MSLTDDLLFKETLTHKDNRNVLLYFLSCFTDFAYEYLKGVDLKVIYESVLTKTKLNDKALRGDILIEFDDFKINIECYSKFNEESFNKSVVYVMRVFSTYMERGNKNYKKLEKIIGINLVDNVSAKIDENLLNEYGLMNVKDLTDRKLASEFILKFYRLDVARDEPYNKSDLTQRWLKFIAAKNKEERALIAEGDEVLMELNNWIEAYINDENKKRIFGEWAEQLAKRKGIGEGLERGFKKV